VAREIRRQREYDGIILDPPKYGRGPKGETWRIEEDLLPLLQQAASLLSANAMFLVLTIYAIRASSLAAHYALADNLAKRPGQIESGELAILESALSDQHRRRYVAQANFARWLAS
jgi:23S rRNA (cytosine1962-C5)-methyltransferase